MYVSSAISFPPPYPGSFLGWRRFTGRTCSNAPEPLFIHRLLSLWHITSRGNRVSVIKVIKVYIWFLFRGDRADYKVVVNGETFLGGDTSKHERTVIDVIRHPDFYSGGLFNDIALLILDQPLEISQFGALINEICLPKTTDYFQDKKCIVAGWNNKGENNS